MLLVGLGGCTGAKESDRSNPEAIATQLRDYDQRISPPIAEASDGLLHALASGSPEMAAQAAVAFGKLGRVPPVVQQQLESMARSGDSRLTQFSALQALLRLGCLSPEIQTVLEQLTADEIWGPVAAQIQP